MKLNKNNIQDILDEDALTLPHTASDKLKELLNYSYGYWDSHARDNHCFMFLTHAALGKEYLAKDSDKATG